MFSAVLARVWPKALFSEIHLHQPDRAGEAETCARGLCFRIVLLKSQAPFQTLVTAF